VSGPEPSPRLVELLRGEGPLLVVTGAGVSAESGLATFRGPGGLWEGREPTSLATPEAFSRDPETVWRFYDWRREQAAAALPNAGHAAIAELERGSRDFLLVTQNVDGLHARAGSRRAVELHGTLWRLRCAADGTESEDLRPTIRPLPPRCDCGALLRPAVVWFGEPLPEDALRAAFAMAERAALALVVGTSGLVYPAAAVPEFAARRGAYVVEVNPEPTALSSLADERLPGPSGEVLPRLLAAAGLATERRT
jgi:NAD-dependent protein deacetylases, SIR2 family